MNNDYRFKYKPQVSSFNIVKCKMSIMTMYYRYFMNSIMSMFKINKLPDTIPEDDLKFIIFKNGFATFGKADDGKLYAFGDDGLGGESTPYFTPTISVVANPSLKFNKTFEIDKDCVIVKCTSTYTGLDEIISLYSDVTVYSVFFP